MISKELMVMADVDRSKTLDEIMFVSVSIWVRIMNLPLGLMNKDVRVTIGKEVGEYMMVDLEDGDVPIRRFLRVRVRLDIRKPLMRGVTVQEEDGKPDRWCPLVYEYLPDFCYICGVIGHTEKGCSIKLKEGEISQFDKSLRFIPQRGRGEGGGAEEIGGRKKWALANWLAAGARRVEWFRWWKMGFRWVTK